MTIPRSAQASRASRRLGGDVVPVAAQAIATTAACKLLAVAGAGTNCAAVASAVEVAVATDAELIFLSISPTRATTRSGGGIPFLEQGALAGAGRAAQARRRNHCRLAMIDDDPGSAIVAMARMWRSDLVVMATHRDDEAAVFPVGPAALAVLSAGQFPVLLTPKSAVAWTDDRRDAQKGRSSRRPIDPRQTTPHAKRHHPSVNRDSAAGGERMMSGFELESFRAGDGDAPEAGSQSHVLILADDGPGGAVAVRQGVNLARDLKSAVTFVAVADDRGCSADCDRKRCSGETLAGCEVVRSKYALEAAGDIALGMSQSHQRIFVTDDRIGEAVVSIAETYGCSLIVVPSHMRGESPLIPLGLKTMSVLKRSTTPVLVTPVS